MENLLVVSKNVDLVMQICDSLRSQGYSSKQVDCFADVFSALGRENFSSIFADEQLLDVSEHEFVDNVRKINSTIQVVFFNSAKEQNAPFKFWTMKYFNFDETKSLLNQSTNDLKTHLEGLGYSSKQVCILIMISKGEGNKSIAQELKISEQGVKYHVGVLLKAFQKANRKELQKHLKEIFE